VGFRAGETMFRDSLNAAERVDADAALDVRITGAPVGDRLPPVLIGPSDGQEGDPQ